MLTSIDVKFIFDNACLSASLGDKGLFSSANIPQIVDVVRRVVFLLFLLCFSSQLANSSPISSSWSEWNIPPFLDSQLRPQVFLVNFSIIWQFLLHTWRHFSHITIFSNQKQGVPSSLSDNPTELFMSPRNETKRPTRQKAETCSIPLKTLRYPCPPLLVII